MKIGKYDIDVIELPHRSKPVCLSIQIVEGDAIGEGGTFDIDEFEKVIGAFYKEHF